MHHPMEQIAGEGALVLRERQLFFSRNLDDAVLARNRLPGERGEDQLPFLPVIHWLSRFWIDDLQDVLILPDVDSIVCRAVHA